MHTEGGALGYPPSSHKNLYYTANLLNNNIIMAPMRCYPVYIPSTCSTCMYMITKCVCDPREKSATLYNAVSGLLAVISRV